MPWFYNKHAEKTHYEKNALEKNVLNGVATVQESVCNVYNALY